jgi:hypothetical protein
VAAVCPGIDVMIAIFCDFCRFSAEKTGVFLKNQCYDQIFARTSTSFSKNASFLTNLFGENIFKIITSVPDDFCEKKITQIVKKV